MASTLDDWIKKVKFKGKNACVELCEQDPDLAVRVFNITNHLTLGETFVEMYKDNEQYHHSAYFISVDLEKPIKRKNESERITKQLGYVGKPEDDPDYIWKDALKIIGKKRD